MIPHMYTDTNTKHQTALSYRAWTSWCHRFIYNW